MKFIEYMSKHNVSPEKYIYFRPVRGSGAKREPAPELVFKIKCSFASWSINLKSSSNNDVSFRFSDRQSFDTFVDGLDDFRRLLDSEITV